MGAGESKSMRFALMEDLGKGVVLEWELGLEKD